MGMLGPVKEKNWRVIDILHWFSSLHTNSTIHVPISWTSNVTSNLWAYAASSVPSEILFCHSTCLLANYHSFFSRNKLLCLYCLIWFPLVFGVQFYPRILAGSFPYNSASSILFIQTRIHVPCHSDGVQPVRDSPTSNLRNDAHVIVSLVSLMIWGNIYSVLVIC